MPSLETRLFCRKDVPEVGPNLNPEPSDCKGVPEPNPSEPEGDTQMGMK